MAKCRLASWEHAGEPQVLTEPMYRLWRKRICRHKECVKEAVSYTSMVQNEKEVAELTQKASEHRRARQFVRDEQEQKTQQDNARLVQKICAVARESERRQVQIATDVGPNMELSTMASVGRRKRQSAQSEIAAENARMLKRLQDVRPDVTTVEQSSRSYGRHIAIKSRMSRSKRPVQNFMSRLPPRELPFSRFPPTAQADGAFEWEKVNDRRETGSPVFTSSQAPEQTPGAEPSVSPPTTQRRQAPSPRPHPAQQAVPARRLQPADPRHTKAQPTAAASPRVVKDAKAQLASSLRLASSPRLQKDAKVNPALPSRPPKAPPATARAPTELLAAAARKRSAAAGRKTNAAKTGSAAQTLPRSMCRAIYAGVAANEQRLLELQMPSDPFVTVVTSRAPATVATQGSALTIVTSEPMARAAPAASVATERVSSCESFCASPVSQLSPRGNEPLQVMTVDRVSTLSEPAAAAASLHQALGADNAAWERQGSPSQVQEHQAPASNAQASYSPCSAGSVSSAASSGIQEESYSPCPSEHSEVESEDLSPHVQEASSPRSAGSDPVDRLSEPKSVSDGVCDDVEVDIENSASDVDLAPPADAKPSAKVQEEAMANEAADWASESELAPLAQNQDVEETYSEQEVQEEAQEDQSHGSGSDIELAPIVLANPFGNSQRETSLNDDFKNEAPQKGSCFPTDAEEMLEEAEASHPQDSASDHELAPFVPPTGPMEVGQDSEADEELPEDVESDQDSVSGVELAPLTAFKALEQEVQEEAVAEDPQDSTSDVELAPLVYVTANASQQSILLSKDTEHEEQVAVVSEPEDPAEESGHSVKEDFESYSSDASSNAESSYSAGVQVAGNGPSGEESAPKARTIGGSSDAPRQGS